MIHWLAILVSFMVQDVWSVQCRAECMGVYPRYSAAVACFLLANSSTTSTVQNRKCGTSTEDLFDCLRFDIPFGEGQAVLWAGNCSDPIEHQPYVPAEWIPPRVPLLVDVGNGSRFQDYESHPLLDRSVMSQVWFELNWDDWANITRNSLPAKEYVDCKYHFVLKGGASLTGSGGLRRHGLTSRSEVQPALHLKLGKEAFGMKKLTFKTLQRDPSAWRELSSLDLYYGLNVAGQRGSLYQIFVNGHGPYTYIALEEVDEKAFFEARFGKPALKGGFSKCACDFDQYLECDDSNVTVQIRQILSWIESKNVTALADSFDLDEWLRVWAANMMSSQTDWVNNAYFYKLDAADRWHYMRYDNDFSFESLANTSVFTWGQSLDRRGLSSLLFSIPTYRNRYVQLISAIAKSNTTLAWQANHDWAAPAIIRDQWFGMENHILRSDYALALNSTIVLEKEDYSLQGVFPFLQERASTALQQIDG